MISTYNAIEEMRKLTKARKSFSFSFLSYSESRANSDGIVEVNRARLAKRDRVEHNKNAEIMEDYVDISTGEQHRFYQPLLLTFNGQKVELI